MGHAALLAVPAFVVNGNSFEPDVPFLAFWMAAIALFVSGRIGLAAAAMVVCVARSLSGRVLNADPGARGAGLNGAQAGKPAVLTPVLVLAGVQIFERFSTGALPAAVLTGYFTRYAFRRSRTSCAAPPPSRSICASSSAPSSSPAPRSTPGATRRDRDTQFLLAWIGFFFAGAVVVFFAGSARYLLPIAAPVALLASRLRPRWLALGFALQMALSVGLAMETTITGPPIALWLQLSRVLRTDHRVWVDGEWGLRYYLEQAGALPLTHAQTLRPADLVVSSALGHAVPLTAPATPIMQVGIRSCHPPPHHRS